MSRNTNPVPQFLDGKGDPLVNGQMFYFKSGTNSAIETFKDDLHEIPNTNPVLLDAAGRLPNVFFDGSAKQRLTADDLDTPEIGKLIWERDPVGGEKELGDFTLWDTTVSYDVNDIVEGSDGKFYISLSNANSANDPLTNADKWNEIRFLGLWNTNITYSVNDVVLSLSGNLWKALTATAANDPETDSGVNWALATNNPWINKSTNFNILAGKSYQIDGSGGAVDGALAASYVVGDVITVHNESISTNLVRLTNTALTIKDTGGTITSSDNLVLEPGNSVQMVAKTTTILEIVGVKV